MDWTLLPQYLALIFLGIIFIYSWDVRIKHSLKTRAFFLGLELSILSVLTFIASRYAISLPAGTPHAWLYLITISDYLLRISLTVVLLVYFIFERYADRPQAKRLAKWAIGPFAIFVLFFMSDPLMHWFFIPDPAGGLARGPAFNLGYAVGGLYTLLLILIILVNLKNIDRKAVLVYLTFPVINLILLVIQTRLPHVYFNGLAISVAMLVLYLNFQNKMNFLDDLTGLQNRKAFYQRLQYHIRQQDKLRILLVSLNNFKVFNNQYGQATGDELLKAMTGYLSEHIRRTELYRFSGDEFALLLLEKNQSFDENKMKALHDRFAEPWIIGKSKYMASACLAGVEARFPTKIRDLIGLLEYCIDLAKQKSPTKIVIATDDIRDKLQRRLQIIEIIRKEIERKGFEVYFQPIYSLGRQRFFAAEALVRLTDSEIGPISPSEFIPLAEKSGHMIALGYLVLERVCQLIRQLEQEQVNFSFISVNFSALQILDGQLIEKVRSLLAQYQFDPGRLSIEITESVFIENHDQVMQVISALKDLGVRFYLDDYGTGYSNIETVIKLDFDLIKIDKSFLYNAVDNDRYLGLLKGVVQMFADLDLEVVLEGIENQNHLSVAQAVKADQLQGFLFARPQPAASIREYFSAPQTLIQ